jgi:DNA-binding PadR family transcriptional regulator
MNSDFNGELLILATLKKWGILSEKQISDYSTLSHRRISSALRRLEQDRLVKMVESGRSIRTYRITGSGMDHLDRVKQRNDL